MRKKRSFSFTAITAACIYRFLCKGLYGHNSDRLWVTKILRSAKYEVKKLFEKSVVLSLTVTGQNVYSSLTHRQDHQPMLAKQACELSPPEEVKFDQACELSPPKDRINALRCSLNVSRKLSTDRDFVSFS